MELTASEVSDWLEKIEESERLIEENHLPYWRSIQQDYSSQLDGDASRSGLHYQEDDSMKINFLLSNANTILPGVISANPHIYVKPRRPTDKDSARIAESALNYVWREIDGNRVIRNAVLDTLLFGVGFVKSGYEASDSFYTEEEYDTGPEKIDPGEEGTEGGLSAAQQRRLRSMMSDEFLSFEEGPDDNPTLSRVAPWDLILPPGYAELGQCPWVCERMIVRLDDLRRDDRFDIPREVEADTWLNEAVPSSLSGQSASNNLSQPESVPEYVTLYEVRYWATTEDGLRRHVMWLLRNPGTNDAKDALVRSIEDPIEMKGYPYEVLRFVHVPNDFYSTRVSDMASVKEIADRLNEEWDYILRHHRLSSRRKFVAAPGALESGQLAALLESSEDMDVAELPASVARIQDAIMLLPEAPPPSTTPMVLSGLSKLMHEVSGIDVFQRGGASRKGTTATEVAIASAATRGRVGMRLEATERFVSALARKMLSIIRQYWDEIRYLRIDGENGEDEFVSFTSSDIQGMFDVNVMAGSTIPTDPAEEQRAFMGLLQTIQGVVATMAPLVQGGLMPPDAIQKFMDQAFRVWRQDKRALVGPLSQLQGAAMSAGAAAQTAEGATPEDQRDVGSGAEGQPLAGAGPREVAPQNQAAIINKFPA